MARPRLLALLAVVIPSLAVGLSGCYADQKKQLAACEAGAPHKGEGQPLKAILACMDKGGYRFIARDVVNGESVVCDIGSVIQGQASADGTDAMCFEPRDWWALRLYRWEVPVQSTPVPASDSSGN
jgi:hypothetical protein